jgi:hypothetical protein
LLHAFVHEVRPLTTVSDGVRTYIEKNRHLRSAVICYQLRLELSRGNFPEMKHITPGQVYYHWATLQMEEYRRDDDAIVSALLMLQERKNIEIICSNSLSYTCIGILTSIFHEVMAALDRGQEFFVDSTCKIHSLSLNTFLNTVLSLVLAKANFIYLIFAINVTNVAYSIDKKNHNITSYLI